MKLIICLLMLSPISLCVEKHFHPQTIAESRISYVNQRLHECNSLVKKNKVSISGLALIIKRLAESNQSPFEDEETMLLATTWYEQLMQNPDILQKKEAFDQQNKVCRSVQNFNELKQKANEYVKSAGLQLAHLMQQECPEFQIPPDMETKITSTKLEHFIELLNINENLPKTALRSVAATSIVVSMFQYPE